MKTILGILLVFSLGAAGGIWAQAFLLPYLASHDRYRSLGFVEEWNQRTTVIQPTQQIVVSQAEGLELAIERGQEMTVLVRSVSGSTVREGSGFVATSDGLIVTLASLVPPNFQKSVYLPGGEVFEGVQVLKRDQQNDLALLKIEKTGLRTAGFAGQGDIRAGSSLVITAKDLEEEKLVSLANQGIVRAITEEGIRTTITESSSFDGSPLFDLRGRVTGLASVDGLGGVSAIPAPVLRTFLGL